MVEVTEVAEDCTILGEAFQKIVSNSGLVVLIFEYDDQHVVEMLWRRRGSGPGGGVLRKAEKRDGPKAECYTCKSATIPVARWHVSSKSLTVLRFRRRSPLNCFLRAVS